MVARGLSPGRTARPVAGDVPRTQGPIFHEEDEDNGLCLYTVHHKAFDCGALSVSAHLRIQVSARLTGSGPVCMALLDLSGKSLRRPQAGYPSVLGDYASWHREHVFKGLGRAGG